MNTAFNNKLYLRELTNVFNNDLKHRSVLLLGPRQTGKSTLLRELFPDALWVDLLQPSVLRAYSLRPELLREQLNAYSQRPSLIVVDEIQKFPALFDEVQSLTDRDPNLRCVLTGSSARKLKRGQANLLGGRLWIRHLHPLTVREAGWSRWQDILVNGGLPRILDSPDPRRDLNSYVGTYLQEEIMSEGLVRSLPQFARFLDAVGTLNAEQVNYTQIGNDAQIKPRTVRDHFQVLIDTLLGFTLAPYSRTKKRKAVATEKFYLFDRGVANALTRQFEHPTGIPSFGHAVEHLIFLELKAMIDIYAPDLSIHYWRSQSQFEVDFVVAEKHAIEVKAKPHVSDADLKGLRALKEEKLLKSYTCVSLETTRRKTDDGILILPLKEFFEALWQKEFLNDGS